HLERSHAGASERAVRDRVPGRGPGPRQDAASGDPHLRCSGRAQTGIGNDGGENVKRISDFGFRISDVASQALCAKDGVPEVGRRTSALLSLCTKHPKSEIRNPKSFFLLALLSASVVLAQPPKKEEPVGLVLLPGGAKLVRSGVETPLAAKPGDILFSGDAMKTEAAPASFLYCPTKSSQSLAPAGDVLFGPAQLKVRS